VNKQIFIGLLCCFALLGCSSNEKIQTVKDVKVQTIQIQKPAPIVPAPDVLKLKSVYWNVLTKNNIDEKMKSTSVYYALDENNYKNLSENLSSIRSYIEQQNENINIYKKSYKNVK
jgi:hypothetical protein